MNANETNRENDIFCNGDVLLDERMYSDEKLYLESDAEINEYHIDSFGGGNIRAVSRTFLTEVNRKKRRKKPRLKRAFSDANNLPASNNVSESQKQEFGKKRQANGYTFYFTATTTPITDLIVFLPKCPNSTGVMLKKNGVKLQDDTLQLLTSSKIIDATSGKIGQIKEALLRKHKHQYESQHKLDIIKTVRSFTDIGRQLSNSKNTDSNNVTNAAPEKCNKLLTADTQKVFSLPKIPIDGCGGSFEHLKGNLHLLKKIPPGAEVSNVLIGQVEFLDRPFSIFIRLKNSVILGDLTEVPLPTRFLFIILGPVGHGKRYREIGRAIATLMSDEIFHDVAYKARNRNDILDGIDEFLDQVTVLPPGEWDPDIRIEPPSSIPSQDKRKQSSLATKDSVASLDKFSSDHTNDDDVEDHTGKITDQTLKRTGKLFGGLVADVKRKLPFYFSDFKDAFHLQCVAAFLYMYLAVLAPTVTFGGLLEESTNRRLAAIENLLSAAVCGTIYSLFSGQPLAMICSTGPVIIFEKIMFDLCEENKLDFLPFRWWINMWSGVILLLIVALDASTLVTYITRFTEENFAVLISFIFIYEAFAKTIKIKNSAYVVPFDKNFTTLNPNCSCKPLGELEFHIGNNTTSVKDYSFLLKHANKYAWKGNISSWTYYDFEHNVTSVDWDQIPLTYCVASEGRLESTEPLNHCYFVYDVFLLSIILTVSTFVFAYALKMMRNSPCFPSKVREILSDFAVIISLTCMVLVDYFVNLDTPKLFIPKEFKPTWSKRGWLIEPFGNNPLWSSILAFPPALLLCILLFMDNHITVVIVNRKENKLKKGCGYHLDLLCIAIGVTVSGCFGLPIMVAATVMSVSHVNSLRVESECRAPGEKPTFSGVREQRVTSLLVFLFIGISVFMKDILKYIPMPVLYGVFLYMGVSSLSGVQMIDRLGLAFMPMKCQPDYFYLRHVPLKRVHLFTAIQLACFLLLCLVKEIQHTSIIFPIMLVVTVAVRKLMEYIFSENELKYLDDKMPEILLRKHDDDKKKILQPEKANYTEESHDLKLPVGAVKTDANLHIKLVSGNVVKIPLSKIIEKPENSQAKMNISKEFNKSGLWIHIASEASFGSKDVLENKLKFPGQEIHLFTENECEPPITINVQQPTPNSSSNNLQNMQELVLPLLPSRQQ